MKKILFAMVCAFLIVGGESALAKNLPENLYAERWGLTLPDGGVGWLGIRKVNDKLDSMFLWRWGGIMPTVKTTIVNGQLNMVWKHDEWVNGKIIPFTCTLTGEHKEDRMELVARRFDHNGKVTNSMKVMAKRLPGLPPAPDLSKVKYGKPIQLFQKDNFKGWKFMQGDRRVGWRMKDGVLSNRVFVNGQRQNCSDLMTEQKFGDFNLKCDVKMSPKGNSGIYLRGNYEIQMFDSYGKKPDPHNMGALYSRVTPSVSAEKPANVWQTIDITFVDFHVTVILNGKKIIDNEPVFGCTGGALSSDSLETGPIFLQGDHTDVDYRNMVITPVIK